MVTPPTGITLQTLVPAANIVSTLPVAAAPVTGVDSYQLAASPGPLGAGTPPSNPIFGPPPGYTSIVTDILFKGLLSPGGRPFSRRLEPGRLYSFSRNYTDIYHPDYRMYNIEIPGKMDNSIAGTIMASITDGQARLEFARVAGVAMVNGEEITHMDPFEIHDGDVLTVNTSNFQIEFKYKKETVIVTSADNVPREARDSFATFGAIEVIPPKPRVTAGVIVADMVKEESGERTLSGGFATIGRADNPPAEGEILPDEDAMSVICERLLQFHTRIDLNQQFARKAGIIDGTGFESLYKKGGEFWTYPGFFHDCHSLRMAVWRLRDECLIDLVSYAGLQARKTGERSESEITRALEKAWRLLCVALRHKRKKFDIPFDAPRDLIDVHFPPSGEARNIFNLKLRAYLEGTDLEDEEMFTATVQLVDFLMADLDEESKILEGTEASEFEEYHFALSKFLRDLADIGIVVAKEERHFEYLARIDDAALSRTSRRRQQVSAYGVHMPAGKLPKDEGRRTKRPKNEAGGRKQET